MNSKTTENYIRKTWSFFTFMLLFHYSPISANDSGWNVFHQDTIDNCSFSGTDGLISGLIDNKVSAMTGEYIDGQEDLTLIGPEVLKWQRFYSSDPAACMKGIDAHIPSEHLVRTGSHYCNWQFNYKMGMHLQFDSDGHERHVETMALVPHPSSANMVHRALISSKETRHNQYIIPLHSENGISNCSTGSVSARTNPDNVVAYFDDEKKQCKVVFGNGGFKKYCATYFETNMNADNQFLMYRLEPLYERKANGNQIVYGTNEIRAYNPTGKTVFSHIKLVRPSKNEFRVESSHFDPLIYRYNAFKVYERELGNEKIFYYLSSLTRPNQPEETYEYTSNIKKTGYLLKRKNLPNNRFFEIGYNRFNDPIDLKKRSKIERDFDPRLDRVKYLKAPVGTDPTPIITHRIFYDIGFQVNAMKGTIKGTNKKTTVFDALLRKSTYSFNSSQLLESLTNYLKGHRYKETKYLWEKKLRCEDGRLSGSPVSNLIGKVILDKQKRIHTGRFFKYDVKGNVLSEKFYGNLTGTQSIPIELGHDQRPVKNGVEYYRKSCRYSHDEFNLLLSEKTSNGREIRYEYVPHTDLIRKKLVSEHDVIRAREFYEYDENNAPVKLTRDNGSSANSHSLKNVTQRHVTYYYPRKQIPVGLPEQIDEMVEDPATGEQFLVKRTVREYSKEGWLKKQATYDADGKYCYEQLWVYDKHGNIIKEINPLGYKILRKYDENDNLIRENFVDGHHTVNYTYDFSNRLICQKEKHDTGEIFYKHYQYDLVGNRISEIDRFGNETRYVYDDLNRLVETIYPAIWIGSEIVNPTNKFKYDIFGNIIKEMDARGYKTEKSYNSRGQITSILHADGRLERFEYGRDGSLVKKIASNGTTTRFKVDCFGRILSESVLNSAGELLSKTIDTYDGLHKTSSTDPAGLTTYYDYDLFGRLVKTTCADKIETYEYDSLGRLSRKNEPFENGKIRATCSEYDLLDRVIEERIEDAEGNVVRRVEYRYDVWGNRTHVIEKTEAGPCIHLTHFNSDNRPVKTIDAAGNESHITYDYEFRNNLNQFVLKTKTVDSLGRQTIIEHNSQEKPINTKLSDPFGLLIQEQDILYDEMGNVTGLIDHEIFCGEEIRTIETVFQYQETGMLTSTIHAKGLIEQQTINVNYNEYGLKASTVKPDGTILYYEYDDLGRLIHYYSSDNSLSYRYFYNVRNQIVNVEDEVEQATSEIIYDEKGRVITEKLANGISISYTYDLLDRVIAVNLPDDNTIAYEYDAVDIKQIRRDQKEDRLFQYCYESRDAAGLNLRATTGNDYEINYAYDRSKRPLSVESKIYKQSESNYDCAGRLTSYQVQDCVGIFHGKLNYSYLDQLVLEEGCQSHAYACDSLHRRIMKNGKKSTFNSLHQLLANHEWTYEYDLAGNLIGKEKDEEKTTYRYDADNRLIEVNSDRKVSYTYDSFHRRMSKIEDGKTTRYIYIGNDEIGSVDESGKIVELRILGESPGAKLGESIAIELQGKIYIPFSDFQGNIVALTDLTGFVVEAYRYTAFGETEIYDTDGKKVETSRVGNPWQFSSKRVDTESGLVYFGRRYYDPENGRWITADPAGLIDGSNQYSFLHHNPIGAWDLYGLFEETQETQEEAYYPLANVDSNDNSANNSQSNEEININEPAPDCTLKRSGKTGKSYYCGEILNECIAFLTVHGIMNSFKDAQATAMERSKDLGNMVVNFVYNESKGLFGDLMRCAGELIFYMDTDRVLNVREEIKSLLAQWSKLYIEPHSEGGIVVRNAVMGLTKEERSQLIIVGFACAAYILDEDVHRAKYYRSQRDIVPYSDVAGLIRCRDSIQVLRPHENAPLFDHTIASPTYREYQIHDANEALKKYGAY